MNGWKLLLMLLIVFVLVGADANAQCSICTKTAMQLGDKPATGLNSGIIYLMFAPFLVVGYIGYRYWKNNNVQE